MSKAFGDDGFTLIETLVSIALLALIVAFLPGMLQLGTRALQSQNDLDAASGAGPARRFIEQRLSSAVPAFKRGTDGRLQLAFNGGTQALSFVAPASLGDKQSGMQHYTLALGRLEPAGKEGALEIASQPYAIEGNTKSQRSTLMQNLTGLSFRYFGRRRGEQSASWHEDWVSESALPQLVEIRAARVSSQGAFERPLIVPLRLAASD